MLSWLLNRSARIKHIEAQADTLIRELGVRAYSEARRRQREAVSPSMSLEWSRIARVVAKRTGKRIGLDTGTRMAAAADFRTGDRDGVNRRSREPLDELDQVDELLRTLFLSTLSSLLWSRSKR
jgi:hypothetical protein